jgi:hypothetical protein
MQVRSPSGGHQHRPFLKCLQNKGRIGSGKIAIIALIFKFSWVADEKTSLVSFAITSQSSLGGS